MTICADDYIGDRCKHQAEETCDVCRREFCWEHFLNIDVTIGGCDGRGARDVSGVRHAGCPDVAGAIC